MLLEHGSPGLLNRDERSPLHLAAECGSLEIVKFLIGLGVNLNAEDNSGETPLYLAAKSGSVKAAYQLIASGARIDIASKDGNLAIHAAAMGGHARIVEQLIDREISQEAPDMVNETKNTECMPLLVQEIPDMVNAKNKAEDTPLHLAAATNEATVLALLRAGADTCAIAGPSNAIPAAVAAELGKGQILKILLDHMPAATEETLAVLMKIGQDQGHAGVLRVLQDRGARINFTNFDTNAIWQAFRSGNLDLCKLLYKNGFDVHTIGPLGMTALHFAAGAGQCEIVSLLLSQGSGVFAVDDWGWTALHSATEGGHETVVQLLLQHGADREARDCYSWLPMHLAAFNRYDCVVRLLTDGEKDSSDVHDFPWSHLSNCTARANLPGLIPAQEVSGEFTIMELPG